MIFLNFCLKVFEIRKLPMKKLLNFEKLHVKTILIIIHLFKFLRETFRDSEWISKFPSTSKSLLITLLEIL